MIDHQNPNKSHQMPKLKSGTFFCLFFTQFRVFKDDHTIRLSDAPNADKCIDIEEYGTADGAHIWLMNEHTDDKQPAHQNQEWSLNSNGTITSQLSGKCIDVQPGKNGT